MKNCLPGAKLLGLVLERPGKSIAKMGLSWMHRILGSKICEWLISSGSNLGSLSRSVMMSKSQLWENMYMVRVEDIQPLLSFSWGQVLVAALYRTAVCIRA